jgi:transposase InsO family protein
MDVAEDNPKLALRACCAVIARVGGPRAVLEEQALAYDNALAESVIGLFKTEEIYRRGPWKGLEDVEFATLEWVAWYNHRRLLEPLGYVPPAEFEEAYYARQATPGGVAVLT